MTGSSPLSTLFAPFEQGAVLWPENALFMGADWHPLLQKADLWQPFKPAADRLASHGLIALDIMPADKTYDLLLLQIPKQNDEAKFWIAQALKKLNENGWLIVSAANDAGGSRLEKWLGEAGCTGVQSYSKNKARVVWAKKPLNAAPVFAAWCIDGSIQNRDFGGDLIFQTQPGLFSYDRIDPASRLLADHLPKDLKGRGADFGCGYGYLSFRALQACGNITSLSLIDADARALLCAEANVEHVKGGREIISCWHDASKPVPCLSPLDFILMNPPFHTGKKTEPDLGKSFIQTAHNHLKKGGVLYLVANNHLPYETELEQKFSSLTRVVQDKGFKLLKAVR